ncbi:MAG: hypothetical protein JSS98_08835 [Bacteroidetes bacterium]|nr:hypothetical protein [Bacteroidota bacterium]
MKFLKKESRTFFQTVGNGLKVLSAGSINVLLSNIPILDWAGLDEVTY